MPILQKLREIDQILKNSITKRLLVVAFSIYMVLTVTVTLFQMRFEYMFNKRQTINALSGLQRMVHDSLSQAIWEFNAPQIESIMRGLASNRFLVGIKLDINDTAGMPDFALQSIGTIADDGLLKVYPKKFDLKHTANDGKQQPIGSMTFYTSNKVVWYQVKDSFILLIINAIIKTIGLWVFFSWAGYYFVSKPLIRLRLATLKLAAGEWDEALELADLKSNKKNEISSLFESFRDMTNKLFKTQDKLENSKSRLDDIFDTMPSALLSVNTACVIQGWNKHMVLLSKIETEDAIGMRLQNIYPAFDHYIHQINRTVESGHEQHIKHARLISSDPASQTKLFNIELYPVLSGDSAEVVIRIDDVTEQVNYDTNLAQVEKLASVGASIAGVAHEINNPLGSIMQSTQNIIRRIDPELYSNKAVADELKLDLKQQYSYLEKREIVKFLNSIREAGERASSIVKNMLKFTRRATEDMGEHDLVALINDTLEIAYTDINLHGNTDANKINVIKSLPASPLAINCFPMEIQQVVLNLFKNAAQALETKQGDKQISINLKQTSADKVQLEIIDNGHGMSEEVKSKLFQPFFTTKPAGIGTGLGLSICRNIIVQRHHGDIAVESATGLGTKFIITLPIHTESYA